MIRIDVPTSILKCASKDSSQYAIDGVLIRRVADRAVAVATDGRALVCRWCDVIGPWPEIYTEPVIVSTASLKAASWRGIASLRLGEDGVFTVNIPGCGQAPVETVEGSFPPYDQLFTPGSWQWFSHNPELSNNVARVLRGSSADPVSVGVESGDKPIVMKSPHGVAVVMPRNAEGADDDSWARSIAEIMPEQTGGA